MSEDRQLWDLVTECNFDWAGIKKREQERRKENLREFVDKFTRKWFEDYSREIIMHSPIIDSNGRSVYQPVRCQLSEPNSPRRRP